MTNNDYERLNFLSDKTLNDSVTDDEITEFSQLLSLWSTTTTLNLFNGHHSLQKMLKLRQ